MLARGLVMAGLLLASLAAPAFADRDGGDGGRGGNVLSSNGTNSLTLSSGVSSVSVQGPGDSSAVSAVTCSPVNSAWAGAISGTSWISRNTDCTVGASSGTFTYTVQFTVPSGATNQQLTGSVMADDSVTVQLNGNQLFSGGGFGSTSQFSTSNASQFTSGTNTLTFVVNNAGGSTGLDFQAAVSASNVTLTGPSPSGNGENGEGQGAHGACVSAVARASHGRGHGAAVSAAAHSCPSGNSQGDDSDD